QDARLPTGPQAGNVRRGGTENHKSCPRNQIPPNTGHVAGAKASLSLARQHVVIVAHEVV
ncbi:hypothetical protein ACLB6G_09430, partial [Zhengella sp. ZM62]|uniref:hypothetical protein n=1 Tax=Zhengella sedimenti TaxID=3390035 RepID=UPI003975D524